MDNVSRELIASYTWELKKKEPVPTDPLGYRNMLKSELEVDDQGLLTLFVDYLDKTDQRFYEDVQLKE